MHVNAECFPTNNRSYVQHVDVFFFRTTTEVLAITQKISEDTLAFHGDPNVFQETNNIF